MPDIPRIYSPPIPNAPALAAPSAAPTPQKQAGATADPPYLAKLMTMFPAEAVTFYTLGSKSAVNPLLVAIVVLLALVAVRWAAFRSSKTRRSNRLAVTVSAISFVLWVFASAEASLLQTMRMPAGPDDVQAVQGVAAFLIAVWTWVVPSFVKLDPD